MWVFLEIVSVASTSGSMWNDLPCTRPPFPASDFPGFVSFMGGYFFAEVRAPFVLAVPVFAAIRLPIFSEFTREVLW